MRLSYFGLEIREPLFSLSFLKPKLKLKYMLNCLYELGVVFTVAVVVSRYLKLDPVLIHSDELFFFTSRIRAVVFSVLVYFYDGFQCICTPIYLYLCFVFSIFVLSF